MLVGVRLGWFYIDIELFFKNLDNDIILNWFSSQLAVLSQHVYNHDFRLFKFNQLLIILQFAFYYYLLWSNISTLVILFFINAGGGIIKWNFVINSDHNITSGNVSQWVKQNKHVSVK